MKFRLVLLLLIGFGLLVGCNNSLSFEEKERADLDADTQNFFSLVDSDGVHVRTSAENHEAVVYINTSNMGDEYVTDFDVYAEDSTLFFSYKTESVSDSSEKLVHEHYYVVNQDQSYETLRLIENGEETYFDTLGY
ncbi:hypothetical protein FLK61_39830 [Paenalkalicoccus suaedae]|uniref:DUF4362 domain-containing protein n=1 Tax=Paenalkalicoccus suaedae TaxID=2592382 RepID=A0A859FIW0_9BACI|nr:hypothetical protein [Paenalkalicoccus suaedae]QKS72764.1 hypothetical protein FLK61_39830 [Paenalkalicoccus suaedae]